jgi:hypothetical protein
VALEVSGHRGPLALAGLLAAAAALLHQMYLNHGFWTRSVGLDVKAGSDDR